MSARVGGSQVSSPFGKYAQQLAVTVALAVVAAFLILLTAQGLGMAATIPDQLGLAFTLVLGAVFGSTATVNGVKAEMAAIQARLDASGLPPASIARGQSTGTGS